MNVKALEKYILEKSTEAFKKTVKQLATEEKYTIETVQYWAGFEGRVTYRQNGEVVYGANRNIVDTRDFTDSLSVEITGNKAFLSWDSEHAFKVYFGELPTPGRDWHTATMKRLGWEKGITTIYLDSWLDTTTVK